MNPHVLDTDTRFLYQLGHPVAGQGAQDCSPLIGTEPLGPSWGRG